LALDVGLRFYKRIEVYASLFLIYSVVTVGLMLGFYFEVIDIVYLPSDYYFIAYEQLIMIFLLYDLVQSGARVNAESEQQILRVSELRIIMEKLLTDWDLLMHCS